MDGWSGQKLVGRVDDVVLHFLEGRMVGLEHAIAHLALLALGGTVLACSEALC